jgi:hypothetical protein
MSHTQKEGGHAKLDYPEFFGQVLNPMDQPGLDERSGGH